MAWREAGIRAPREHRRGTDIQDRSASNLADNRHCCRCAVRLACAIEDLAVRRAPDRPRPNPEIARHAALDTSVTTHPWTAVMKTVDP
jgi:hypothetical protein